MGRRERPPGATAGKGGRPPKAIAAEKLRITQILCARARVVHGMTMLADVQQWVIGQEVWLERFTEHGPPSDTYVANVWRALNPENVDLCANLDREKVQRTASEERHAAIVRARETVNRWYGIERDLTVQLADPFQDLDFEKARKLEERIGRAQEHRMEAERQLAELIGMIDDESFESAPLRSEVIGILARNRAHFTAEEAERVCALFAPAPAVDREPDPDLPDYLQ